MTPTDPPPGSGVERRTDGVERALQEDLDRFRLECMLARQDASAELTQQIQAAAPIDLGDVGSAVERLEGTAIPSFVELESMLSSEDAGVLRLDDGLLSDLLREGVEGQTVLKRGLAFLKHRKYAQAIEWWSLNRAGLVAESSKLHLLLLIMEAMTYHLAGDQDRAQATRQKVMTHPLYRRSNSERK